MADAEIIIQTGSLSTFIEERNEVASKTLQVQTLTAQAELYRDQAQQAVTDIEEASADLIDRVEVLEDTVTSGRRGYHTYAEMIADAAPAARTLAEVPTTDVGTHTDPVVGGTVANTGVFRYSTSPAGWERLYDTDAATAAPFAAAAEIDADRAEAAATSIDGVIQQNATPLALNPDGSAPIFAITSIDDVTNQLYSYLQIMQDGSLLSSLLNNYVMARIAGIEFSEVNAPGWGPFVITKLGLDGRPYALLGMDEDYQLVGMGIGGGGGAVVSTTYAAEELIPLDDPPVLLADGYNGMLGYGQSLGEGIGDHRALTLTPPYLTNITFGGGVTAGMPGSTAVPPPLNTTPGTTTIMALVEDTVSPDAAGNTTHGETGLAVAAAEVTTLAAINDNIDPANCRIFASSPSKGSMKIEHLNSSSAWWPHFEDHLQEQYNRSLETGRTYACHGVFWAQGEGNAVAGADFVDYRDKLIQLAVDIDALARSITGQTSPCYLLTYQTPSTVTGTREQLNTIQLAQIAAADASPLILFIGPIYHIPMNDGTHPIAEGYIQWGRSKGRAFYQMLVKQSVPQYIREYTATVRGTELRVKFANVPQRPLRFDIDLVPETSQYGFKVIDDVGVPTISDLHIENGDEVVGTLSRTLNSSDNPVLRYALDNTAAGLDLNGPSGNLVDSTSINDFTFADVEYNIPHVCRSFSLPIFILES